jgi:long-chain fatty acid transport protein
VTTKFAGAALAACCALWAVDARASGFYFGDNGTKPMLMGGAFAGQADDLTAINYNPAGLAKQDSFSALVDMDFLLQNISFHRQDPGFDPNAPATLTNNISVTGFQPLPFFGLSYGFKLGGRNLTIAAGLYGPPAVGKVIYPSPNYERDANGKYLEDPRKFAPHRYGLLKNDILVFYPSLAAAYDFDKYIQVGAVFQLVVSNFKFAQVVYSGLSTPSRIADENGYFDNVASVDLNGDVTTTSVLGVMIRPIDQLSFGVSVRPELPIMARGKMTIEQGEAARALGATVTDANGVECTDASSQCNANFPVVLPLEIRVGLSAKPIPMLTLNADFVYQGWSALKEFVLEPQGVALNIGSNPPQKLADIHSPKKWYDTYSARFGAAVNLGKWVPVTLHLGFMYESGAMPDDLINLDFMNFERVFFTGGVTVGLGPVDIVAGAYGTPEQTKVVQKSNLLQGTSDAAVTGNGVGAGIYKTGGVGLSIGLRVNFGEERKAAAAKVKGETASAAPAPAPAPAPAGGAM